MTTKKTKRLSVVTLRRRAARQFREAARRIGEHEVTCGCAATLASGGLALLSLFDRIIFPREDRAYAGLYWLGVPFLGHEEFYLTNYKTEDYAAEAYRNRRVIGLLLCAEFVSTLSRADFHAAGYKV